MALQVMRARSGVRIIAGAAKGLRLRTPAGPGTRPMMDRVREALFSSLGAAVDGAVVLDLFAGSGSLGLEALSRGAASAVFVERSRAAIAALQSNVAAVGLGGEVVASDVEAFLAGDSGRYHLVFVDPPYAAGLASVARILALLAPRLADDAVVVLHRRAGDAEPVVPEGLGVVDRRSYGDAEITRLAKEEEA
jgi:16S rRNA (guanine966-N2)-methyltransferase